MRLKIVARPASVLAQVKPLIEFAASHFNVTGTVTVNFSVPHRQRLASGKMDEARQFFSGRCYWGLKNPIIYVRSVLEASHSCFPFQRKTLGYFPKSRIPITPYELRTPEEMIIHVAAHEFAHLMPRGNQPRMSRREVFCENKATEVLEAWRSGARDREIQFREDERHEEVMTSTKEIDTPREVKKKQLLLRQKNWESKFSRAKKALQKIQRQLRSMDAYQRKTAKA